MTTYATSYLRWKADPSITYAHFVWVMSVTVMTQGLCTPVTGAVERRLGSRLTCLLGCLVFSSGVALTYYTVRVSVGAVVVTYGCMVGVGMALAYIPPLGCAMRWFPARKGKQHGLSSISRFIFSNITVMLYLL